MVRVTRPGDPVTVGLTRLGQARVLEERPTPAGYLARRTSISRFGASPLVSGRKNHDAYAYMCTFFLVGRFSRHTIFYRVCTVWQVFSHRALDEATDGPVKCTTLWEGFFPNLF